MNWSSIQFQPLAHVLYQSCTKRVLYICYWSSIHK